MACPHVAGVCGLILSENSGLNVDDVRDILHSTAIDLGPSGKDDSYGYGKVNAEAAVQAA